MENRLISSLPEFLLPVQEELGNVQKLILAELKDCQPEVLNTIQQRLFTGGKRVRPAIILFIGKALQGPKDEIIRLAAAVELLHNATLIHDDLIDDAAFRHHHPTIHITDSPQLAVLVGDYLFAHAAKIVAEIGSKDITVSFTNTLLTIINGEIHQYLPGSSKPDIWLYEKRIYQKTASLFEASALLAAILCDAQPELLEALRLFGYHAGMAFQMMDDVLDFVGEENNLGKLVGSDLRQGILNLPTILYLADNPQSPYAASIMDGSCANNEALVSTILTAIKQSPAINKALIKIDQHIHAGQKQLMLLPESSGQHGLLDMLSYLSRRIQ